MKFATLSEKRRAAAPAPVLQVKLPEPKPVEITANRERAILAAVEDLEPCTDRMVMKALGFTDPNAVRPRITRLINLGMLRVYGTTTCVVTGRPVRLVERA